MNEITLILETVTPLFLGGFDPRDEPELRPPAIRGALRYWLRAAIGGVVGDKDRDKLSDLENQVFGKADDKIGASAITLRFRNPTFRSASYSVLTGVDTIKKTAKYPGIAYLWFSARGTKKEKERYALVGEFRLEIQSRLGVKQAHQRFQEAYLALWLWLHLGGLGSRARRAGGNLQVMDVEGDFPLLGNLPLKISAKTPQELATELEVGITQCRKLLSESYFPDAVSRPSAYDILHPDVCKLWVCEKTYKSWQEAVDE
ncbi:MAG: type III-B CRISPR module RAMP protein Cmr1, partial [Anaerolineales bacterium]|nr:type III-B CRISPR module RAMP protein Cmr1 [Anaerolineales bacterium]MDW8446849.1 type III-B CRISPR module RAMP protein Cmr1 [Anaerolineales bacterium]